jgi:hypothetical protein
MVPIVSTLIAVSLLGLMFNSTRWMGIAAVALLTFRYPFPSLVALAIGVAVFVFIKSFK